jgi:hypothetical protein
VVLLKIKKYFKLKNILKYHAGRDKSELKSPSNFIPIGLPC